MKRPISEMADKLLPQVKTIESVLPEIIRIAKEGDVIKRTARLLQQQGWSEEDIWRESKKLGVSQVFTGGLRNMMRDFRLGLRIRDETEEWAEDLARSLRFLKKKH